ASSTRASGPAKLRPWQRRVQSFPQLLLIDRSVFLGVPTSEPFFEQLPELLTRNGAVLVCIRRAEKSRPHEPSPPPALTARSPFRRRPHDAAELFDELVLVQLAGFIAVHFVEPGLGQTCELLLRKPFILVLVPIREHPFAQHSARSETSR